MKEIIIVTNYMTNGGAQRVLSELANEWVLLGNKVTIIQTMSESALNNNYRLNKRIEIINLKSHSIFLWDSVYKTIELYKILLSRKNAVVINFTNPTLLFVGICALFLNNRFVFSERNYPKLCPHSPLKRLVRNIIFNFANMCVFQTNDAMEYFSETVQHKAVIIHNPINPDLPERYNGIRRKAICAVGRLNSQKNYPMLIKAFSAITNEYPDYYLEIFGRGEDEEKIRTLIKNYGLEERIKLLGFSDNIFEKIIDCSMFVTSSNYEGISNSLLEALGMGLPVISTDCPVGGAKMLIKSELNGLLIPVGDAKALSDAMRKILSKHEYAEKLGHEAVKIKQRFNIDSIAKQWLAIM